MFEFPSRKFHGIVLVLRLRLKLILMLAIGIDYSPPCSDRASKIAKTEAVLGCTM